MDNALDELGSVAAKLRQEMRGCLIGRQNRIDSRRKTE